MAIVEEKTINEEAKSLLDESKQERNEIITQLKLGDAAYDLGEWITVKNYAEKFGIEVHVIYNWIRRKKIPESNILIVEELNRLTLIKAVPYID